MAKNLLAMGLSGVGPPNKTQKKPKPKTGGFHGNVGVVLGFFEVYKAMQRLASSAQQAIICQADI